MSSSNPKTKGSVIPRLANGTGAPAAIQNPMQTLRRLTLANLLWEDGAYVSGTTTTNEICKLIPLCDPVQVGKLALEIREQQGLRHVPLLLVREMFRVPSFRQEAGKALFQVIKRADEITEFVALYWKDGKRPLAAQMKKALAQAFTKFDEYQLAKYAGGGKTISLRDVMHLVHAKPNDVPDDRALTWNKEARKEAHAKSILPGELSKGEHLYFNLVNKTLTVPATREVLLSAAKSPAERKSAYEALLSSNKLGTMAMLKNLKGMDALRVDRNLIKQAMSAARPDKILPLQFFTAFAHAPQFRAEIEELMKKCLRKYTKLTGTTILVLDVSGSMWSKISTSSEFSRQDAAAALAIMAKEMCENPILYLTAGSDLKRVHQTSLVPVKMSGFDLWDYVRTAAPKLGGGGIFTRQALEHIQKDFTDKQVDRIIVFSDSQDCDLTKKTPAPFGKYNYIADVSCARNGINYKGVWTQEISGWSQMLIEYIAQCEAGYQSNLF